MKRSISLLLFPIVLFSFTTQALALPNGDSYTASAVELVDTYNSAPLTFDGTVESVPTIFNLTQINERFESFSGFSGGAPVTLASGANTTVSSWSQSGHVVEFTVSSTDGGFLTFTPDTGNWGVTFEDIDVLPASGSTPEVVGIFFDFTNSSLSLPYSLDPFSLNGLPLGVGPHPLQGSNQVLYVTDVGSTFDNYEFGTISNQKLTVQVSSPLHFELQPLSVIVEALGVSSDHSEPPFVDTFQVGILVTGLEDTPETLPGDYNCDNTVDAADYAVWRNNRGATGVGECSGDGDGDGDVDQDDYSIWRANYGRTQVTESPLAVETVAAVTAPVEAQEPEETVRLRPRKKFSQRWRGFRWLYRYLYGRF